MSVAAENFDRRIRTSFVEINTEIDLLRDLRAAPPRDDIETAHEPLASLRRLLRD